MCFVRAIVRAISIKQMLEISLASMDIFLALVKIDKSPVSLSKKDHPSEFKTPQIKNYLAQFS